MSAYDSESWPTLETSASQWPSAIVLNEDARTVVGEFPDYGTAYVWIADTHDHQENLGLPLANYRIIPVRSTPNGRDIR